MSEDKRVCPRCSGHKKMYKMGNGYSLVECGWPKVDCPMCLGEGKVKTLEKAIKEAEKKFKLRKTKVLPSESADL